jgi:NodT family efflux transporter outer membrane factor (OMF) lipoprotein
MNKCLVSLLIVIFFAGCTVGPKYTSPEIDIPCNWCSPLSNGLSEENPDCFVWWEALQDPVLNSLIEQAYENNLDLSIAVTRLLAARLERKGKCAQLYPRIDGSATCGHLYYNKDLLVNDILGGALTPDQERAVRRNVGFFEIGFDAEWEIDLFGVTTHEINSLKAKIQSAEETFHDVWVTLSAEVARNYIELRSLQHRLLVTEKNMRAQKEIVKITEELMETGFTSLIDLRQAEEQAHTLKATIPMLQFAIDKTIHVLSTLLGYEPCELYTELNCFSPLPSLPCDKPVGIPSDLLRRRPDIRRAERNLASAAELIGSAVASYFPRFSLTGFLGDISADAGSLFNAASATWFIAPQFLLPIFNSRLIEQDIEFNKIKTQEAFYEYRKVVLGALEETENALAAYHYESLRNESLLEAQVLDKEAYDLTLDLYEKGLKDYLSVLVLSKTHFANEDAFIQSQAALLINYVSLYKALGGAW